MKPQLAIPAAIGVVALLAAPSVASASAQTALVTLGGLAIIAGIGREVLGRVRRDKYDLGDLRGVDERAELRRIEDEQSLEGADLAVCVRCGEAYDPRFPVCPHCGNSV